jgi:hypothetical protein
MNNRTVMGILVVLALAALAAGAWYFFFRAPSPAAPSGPATGQTPFGEPAGGTGTGSGTSASTSTATTIQDAFGGSVAVPAFTTGRASIYEGNQTYYDLSHPGSAYGDENDQFDILYGANQSYFLITLLTEPLGAARLAAEASLRSTLQLPDAELCKLNLTVGVPYGVNHMYSTYQNLGLSFCPGAVALP